MTRRGVLVPPSVRGAHVLDAKRHWECPSCFQQHITEDPRAVTPLHPCKAHKGMAVPFVQVFPGRLNQPAHHHRLVDRGDYVRDEQGLAYDAEGRAVMAVHTERKDGSHDTAVFPARAVADPVEE